MAAKDKPKPPGRAPHRYCSICGLVMNARWSGTHWIYVCVKCDRGQG